MLPDSSLHSVFISVDTSALPREPVDVKLNAAQRKILESFQETTRLVRRLDRIADEEIGELLSSLPPAKRDRVLAAFSALYFSATTECCQCFGKSYRGVDKCGLCRGGRMNKDVSIVRLMKEVDSLRRECGKLHESGDVAVAPI